MGRRGERKEKEGKRKDIKEEEKKRKKKEIKGIQMGKYFKVLLFAVDVIIYVGNPKNPTKIF